MPAVAFSPFTTTKSSFQASRSRGRWVVMAARPARLRIEIQGFLSQTVALLATDGSHYDLFQVRERSFETVLVMRLVFLPYDLVNVVAGGPSSVNGVDDEPSGVGGVAMSIGTLLTGCESTINAFPYTARAVWSVAITTETGLLTSIVPSTSSGVDSPTRRSSSGKLDPGSSPVENSGIVTGH